jgi:hypothetical protein
MKQADEPLSPNGHAHKFCFCLTVQQIGIGGLNRLTLGLSSPAPPVRCTAKRTKQDGSIATFSITKDQLIHRVFDYNQPAIRPADKERSFL